MFAGWHPWFFPFALEGFSTLNLVSPLCFDLVFFVVYLPSFTTEGSRDLAYSLVLSVFDFLLSNKTCKKKLLQNRQIGT